VPIEIRSQTVHCFVLLVHIALSLMLIWLRSVWTNKFAQVEKYNWLCFLDVDCSAEPKWIRDWVAYSKLTFDL